MNIFEPPILENGTYKKTTVKPFPFQTRMGLSGERVDEILQDAEEKGFLTIPLKNRDHKQLSLQNTYLARCKEKKQLYVEVFVDDEWNRAFACFDTISLPKEDQHFVISEMILSVELNTYYENLSPEERGRLFLPAHMNPYTRSMHTTNFFILPKQICFSFYQNQPEIFNFALRKLRFKF